MIQNTAIPAIPTIYNGTQFRSRLEAKWAAYFDTVCWEWEYEPLDLAAYIPDFVLHFDRPVLVEVKPIMTLDELKNGTLHERLKIEHSGWAGESLIVGSRMFGDGMGHRTIGLMRCTIGHPGPEFEWDPAFVFHCGDCRNTSFAPESQGWQCRVHGCYDGNAHLGAYDPDPDFRKAANEVQWRRPA